IYSLTEFYEFNEHVNGCNEKVCNYVYTESSNIVYYRKGYGTQEIEFNSFREHYLRSIPNTNSEFRNDYYLNGILIPEKSIRRFSIDKYGFGTVDDKNVYFIENINIRTKNGNFKIDIILSGSQFQKIPGAKLE
ncbi:MAG: hypothetical protein HRU03_07225, partial [Nanoarchaeales archaeon]|nr:hypothetical protein [Nanoarchaeales archaeon]